MPIVSNCATYITIKGFYPVLKRWSKTLILDDNPKSLDQSLFMFNKFSECAGLRVNLDKTEAIWLGTRRGCHEQLLPDKQLL
jgi:hypothetical protein